MKIGDLVSYTPFVPPQPPMLGMVVGWDGPGSIVVRWVNGVTGRILRGAVERL